MNSKISKNPSVQQGLLIAGITFLVFLLFIILNRPTDQYDVLNGTVETVRVDVTRLTGTRFTCRIAMEGGVLFESRCNDKPGARVKVYRYRRHLSGAYLYELQ
ncbi:hypothetical protein [Stenotrophobium rhamnosiphilum]|uniref:hypothetical protein n=1 Tax=Stenotrophobium rhamnosiphilum TaxID=2029166 RepID=UPI0011B28EFA|nr:hypothetical protein [Stenotrophobium rhamnosiphilum]